MKFERAAAPHMPAPNSVRRVMGRVLLALVPGAAAYVWFFGWGLVFNMMVASLFALLSEALVLHLRGRDPIGPLRDGSAVLAAVLLAFALPPLTPWWITALGAGFAVGVTKQLYGGLGYNVFNPAMAGYVVLLISFPAQMSHWSPPHMGDLDYPALSAGQTAAYTLTGHLPADLTMDALTRATPLDSVRTGLAHARTLSEIRTNPLFGDFGGRGWEWIANFFALGGLWLLYKGVIRWHIPVSMLASLLGLATLFYLIDPGTHPGPGFHLFSGATLLGAFFIATDPVSAATSDHGRLIYGAGVGVLTYVIRGWGGYPDGVAFAVLLMNLCVPLIDRYTVPRAYGQ